MEWVVDQYRVKTDKRSGIENNPNRADDEEYIVDLIRKVISVSLETVRIVERLSGLDIWRGGIIVFMKSGFMAIVLMLSVIFAGELVVLSEQNSPESATPQTQVLNDTSGGKASTQTPQDPVTQKMQSSNDITEENLSTGIRIFGIHFDPTIRLDVLLSVIIVLFGVVIKTLLILIFGSKTRSKSPPELIIEVVSKPENAGIRYNDKPENASEVEEYIKAIDRNPIEATLWKKL